ncbi:MAG: PAS domain-containing methyl-accepting chemotaxis protein [Actinomycetota bacterium]
MALTTRRDEPRARRHRGRRERSVAGDAAASTSAASSSAASSSASSGSASDVALRDAADERRELLMSALDRSQAIIRFEPDGTIIDANANFLSTLGYRREEIIGRHHRMFVDPLEAATDAYRILWEHLAAGRFRSGEFRRLSKSGDPVWIQATYNPVVDADGDVVEVVKLATDVTMQKEALRTIQDRTGARIEFLPDGTILDANENFLRAAGRSLEEIRGGHHRIFMPSGEDQTEEYRDLWRRLGEGEFIAGDFRRVRGDGSELWLRGAYSPVLDADGRVVSVVKNVVDVTEQLARAADAERVGRTIASAVGEMSAAVDEISRTTSRTADLAASAESGAVEASARVAGLDDASTTIGAVVSLIRGLSEQTNLLALNATIEAARAGEAGRGFAVVANEVKVLADRTGTAAGDIGSSVETMQTEVHAVVEMIRGINDGITEVSGAAGGVAAAIEEQNAVMKDMRRAADDLLHNGVIA